MIRLEDRQNVAQHIEQAHTEGARLKPACRLAGIDVRTLQRWKALDGLVLGDKRPSAVHPRPAHALSDDEREAILKVANEPRFAEAPPARIVPGACRRRYLPGERVELHRVLRAAGQSGHRGPRLFANRSRRRPMLPQTRTRYGAGT